MNSNKKPRGHACEASWRKEGVRVRVCVRVSSPGCVVLRKEGKGGEQSLPVVTGMLPKQGLWGRMEYEWGRVYPTRSMVKTYYQLAAWSPCSCLCRWWVQMLKTKATQFSDSSAFPSLQASAVLLIDAYVLTFNPWAKVKGFVFKRITVPAPHPNPLGWLFFSFLPPLQRSKVFKSSLHACILNKITLCLF